MHFWVNRVSGTTLSPLVRKRRHGRTIATSLFYSRDVSVDTKGNNVKC